MAPSTRPRGVLPPGVHDPESLDKALAGAGYLADAGLTTALFLALRLARPILLEGEAGVGKTEVCLLYTSPSPRDRQKSRMPSSA